MLLWQVGHASTSLVHDLTAVLLSLPPERLLRPMLLRLWRRCVAPLCPLPAASLSLSLLLSLSLSLLWLWLLLRRGRRQRPLVLLLVVVVVVLLLLVVLLLGAAERHAAVVWPEGRLVLTTVNDTVTVGVK